MVYLVLLALGCVLGEEVGDTCSDQCSGNGWCEAKRLDKGGAVVKCADQTRYGLPCLERCQKTGEDYFWCPTGNFRVQDAWDYCALQGSTHEGKPCVGKCEKQGKDYWWCNTANGWGYCSPPGKIQKASYTSQGQECVDECSQKGEDYWWCSKSIRWAQSKHTDAKWQYCSPKDGYTRYNVPCKTRCGHYGKDYYWCDTADSWDYCSPRIQSLQPVKARGGAFCDGLCDTRGKNYQWCNIRQNNSNPSFWSHDWWDYCGASLAPNSFAFHPSLGLVVFLHAAALWPTS